MPLLIIFIICALDIIARTYITKEGIYYETPSGKIKWISRKEKKSNGKNVER